MNGKRGSAGQWLIIIFLVLLMGGLILFISSNIFYKKSQIYTKEETQKLLENSCSYIDFSNAFYFGQTPTAICEDIKMKPKFLFIREVVSVSPAGGGNIIYQDENYLVDTLLFNVPLGKAEDFERSYGNPSFENKGTVNRYTSGLLCCR